jgi:hypothetical protein
LQGSGLSSLAIVQGANTPAGSYPLTITASSGPLVHSATATLVIVAASDFTISAPPAISIKRNSSGSETVTISAVNGFAGTVNLAVSGLPSLVTAAFKPTTVSGSGTSTLTFTVDHRAQQGSTQITVTGSSGLLTHTTSVTLSIN